MRRISIPISISISMPSTQLVLPRSMANNADPSGKSEKCVTLSPRTHTPYQLHLRWARHKWEIPFSWLKPTLLARKCENLILQQEINFVSVLKLSCQAKLSCQNNLKLTGKKGKLINKRKDWFHHINIIYYKSRAFVYMRIKSFASPFALLIKYFISTMYFVCKII